jgi:hypothetical protein
MGEAGEGAVGVTADIVEQVQRLCDAGLYLNAHGLLPALQADGRVSARLLAARVLWHLGARREADGRVLKTWREHREDAAAQIDMVRCIFARHGPYRAWKVLQTQSMATARRRNCAPNGTRCGPIRSAAYATSSRPRRRIARP